MVVGVGAPRHETHRLGAVDQPDRAVVAHQQVAGDVGHRRALRLGVTAHGQQQLVLRGGQALRLGRPLAPVQEPAQGDAERQQVGVLPVRERRGVGHHASVPQLTRPRPRYHGDRWGIIKVWTSGSAPGT